MTMWKLASAWTTSRGSASTATITTLITGAPPRKSRTGFTLSSNWALPAVASTSCAKGSRIADSLGVTTT